MSLHRAAPLSAVAAALLAAAALSLRRVVVQGDSMAPDLLAGDHLLVLRRARVRPGDVVALRDPRDPSRALVKRCVAGPGGSATCAGRVLRAEAGYLVLGDNLPASTDSRVFGPAPRRLLLGRCVYRYAPEARRGRPARRGP